ncbi:TIGR00282 family metallophosphoesterase [bacterium]|nr:TIGR00282 family metallophosphoesterase [bacterium]
MVSVLCIGDIVGKPGRHVIQRLLSELKTEHEIDITIANIENAAGGFGVTMPVYTELVSQGIDICTSGNHIYDKRDILNQFDQMPRLIRPINFPEDSPGKGIFYHTTSDGFRLAVINAIGRVFMGLSDCPFRKLDRLVDEIRPNVDGIIVDFHAEATSEKQAIGWMLAGRVSGVFGTHTHVMTADESILEGATAYITDLGMTGAKRAILGMETDPIVKKFFDQLPVSFNPSKSVEKMINSVKIRIDRETGNAIDITRIQKVIT